jgi:hypothetical protein
MRERWLRFWFAPASAANLGFCRLVFFALVLLMFFPRDFSALGAVSPAFWDPIHLFEMLRLRQPSADQLQIVQVVWKAALVASCAGVLTRIATVIAFFLGTYLLGLLFSFGGLGHAKSILVFVMGILALSRCGDAFSVDRWLRARRGEPRPRDAAEYRWPIRMIWVAITCVFFGAGMSKLRHAGLAWAAPDTLAFYLIQANYPLARPAAAPPTDWGLWFVRHPLAIRSLAAGTLAVEVAFPLALFSRRMRPILVGGAFLMQLGIAVVMGPDFTNFFPSYVFWIPWDRLARQPVRTGAAERESAMA